MADPNPRARSPTATAIFDCSGPPERLSISRVRARRRTGAGDAILRFNGAPSIVRYSRRARIHVAWLITWASCRGGARARLNTRAIFEREVWRHRRDVRLLIWPSPIIVRRQGPTGDPVLDHRVATSHMIVFWRSRLCNHHFSDNTREEAARSALPARGPPPSGRMVLANLSEVRLSTVLSEAAVDSRERYVHECCSRRPARPSDASSSDERLKRAYALLTRISSLPVMRFVRDCRRGRLLRALDLQSRIPATLWRVAWTRSHAHQRPRSAGVIRMQGQNAPRRPALRSRWCCCRSSRCLRARRTGRCARGS